MVNIMMNVINKNKKIFAICALFTFGSFLISCGGTEKKTITFKKFAFVDAKHFDGYSDPQNLTISKDGKSIYLTVNYDQNLIYGDASDPEKDIVWKEIPLKTGLSGAAGLAELNDASKVTNISPGKKGALISVIGTSGGGNGAFYVEGATHKAAWASRPEDLNTLTWTVAQIAAQKAHTDAGGPPANGPHPGAVGVDGLFARDAAITGVLVQDKDGKDVPYFWGGNSNNTWNIKLAMTKKDLSPGIADALVKKNWNYVAGNNFAVAPFVQIPYMASGGAYIFAVPASSVINFGAVLNPHNSVKLGATVIPINDTGARADFADVSPNIAPQTSGVVGADSFQMKTGIDNDAVQNIAVFGNKLYIAFGIGQNFNPATGATTGDRDFNGGAAVYHIEAAGTAPKVFAPSTEWDGIAVTGFINDAANNVYAITGKNLFKVSADAKKGESYFDTLPVVDENFETASGEAGYVKKSFPTESMRDVTFKGAGLVGDHLLIATDKGLIAPKKIEKKAPAKK